MEEQPFLPSFQHVRLFISNLVASRTARYYDVNFSEYIDHATMIKRARETGKIEITSTNFRIFGYSNEDEIAATLAEIKTVQQNPLTLFFAFNSVAQILAGEKFRPYAEDYFHVPGPTGIIPVMPAGLDLATFQYALQFEGPGAKSAIITDVQARALHQEEEVRRVFEEQPGVEELSVRLPLRGIWYYMALSDPLDRNSPLTGKFYAVTNRLDWVDENSEALAKVRADYTAWLKASGAKASLFVPVKIMGPDGPVAPAEEEQRPTEPVREPEPAARPAITRRKMATKKVAKVLVPPKEKEELVEPVHQPQVGVQGPPEIQAPQPIPGRPKIQAAPTSETKYELLGQQSVKNYLEYLQSQNICKTTAQRNALMTKISQAALWQDKSKNVAPTGKKGGDHLNLIGFRMNMAKNGAGKTIVHGVDGSSLYGYTDLDGKSPIIRVAVGAEQSNIIVWDGSGKRSANNRDLNYYVSKFFLQAAFDTLVQTCLPNEASAYKRHAEATRRGGSRPTSSGVTFESNEEYLKLLDEVVSSGETSQVRRSFAIIYPAEENVGFPPGVIAMGVLQQEENIEPGQALPNIRRPRQLLATLDINDTDKRAEILEENIREFRLHHKQPTTISQLREIVEPVPANVKRSNEPFKVYKPQEPPKQFVNVDLRIPRAPGTKEEVEQDIDEDDE